MSEQWRKSSRSHSQEACVALNGLLDSVRDTKNGATLTVHPAAITALIRTARGVDVAEQPIGGRA